MLGAALIANEPEAAQKHGEGINRNGLAAGGILPEFLDAVYVYDRVGYDRRPMQFRRDGTIGEGGGDAERYHFGIRRNGRVELVIGSVWEETCTLAQNRDGSWARPLVALRTDARCADPNGMKTQDTL